MDMITGKYLLHKQNAIEFIRAYCICALWSSTDGDEEPMDKNHSIEDIDGETFAAMVYDCEKFFYANHEKFYGHYSQAGNDLWLSRNGHGSGYFDRAECFGENCQGLQDAAKKYGEVALYVGDDGSIYC
jgi:hypothetical protein